MKTHMHINKEKRYVDYRTDSNGYHRLDGPARIWRDGVYQKDIYEWQWCFDGQMHRTDGNPAWNVGDSIRWYCHGLLHNPNGPAHIQLSKDLGWKIIYSIKGRGVSYLEFKDQYMVTHLREYEPIDAQKAYYYWKGLDLSYEFV